MLEFIATVKESLLDMQVSSGLREELIRSVSMVVEGRGCQFLIVALITPVHVESMCYLSWERISLRIRREFVTVIADIKRKGGNFRRLFALSG